ncbi:MAG: CcoQ/FixQ family Cbb3-type cytochrome c oxidase assembly chaperone [Betaproteobacteria bacterium]|nr:MAG: CcoQ/FixQ family Cbb3-type cytochrome c oxidase assembly chaperone [Betaproteobacteria bacterium]
MDINTLRSIVTVVAFTVFIAIVLWAYSDRSKAAFDRAARLPFDEEDDETGYGERK